MTTIPDSGGTGQPDQADGDTDWATYRGLCNFELDLTAIMREADRVAVRAAAAQSAPHAAPATEWQHGIPWPPGRAGTIARFLYDTSYSPIREVAITAAIGLLAGVCGRAYRTHTGKDLALYVILVARSGVGKDAMHDGIPMMLSVSKQALAYSFLRAQDFVSGEALHKELLREPGFLYLQGEFGRKLKRMANPTDAPMQTFRTIMTNAFGKQYLEGKTYSNKADSLAGVEWPALSFLGETTPTTFLECLTPDMMHDGFLSRFLIVTYDGGKPPPNRERDATLPPEDLTLWRDLVGHAAKYLFPINLPEPITAEPDEAAQAALDKFDDDCRDRLNATENEMERPVWTRAHLKALKVASLLAVADNYLNPVVRVYHAAWALGLVERDIHAFRSNQQNGDVGVGDDARQRKLISVIRDYIARRSIPASYKVNEKMHRDGVVPRFYLQNHTSSVSSFANHKLGAGKALDETLRSMIDNGWLMEGKRTYLHENYDFHGKAFLVLDAAAFI